MSIESATAFLTKIDSDTLLQEEFSSTVRDGDGSQVVKFAKDNGFDVTEGDLQQLADQARQVELSDDDLDSVVGGARGAKLGNLRQTSSRMLGKLYFPGNYWGGAGGDPT